MKNQHFKFKTENGHRDMTPKPISADQNFRYLLNKNKYLAHADPPIFLANILAFAGC